MFAPTLTDESRALRVVEGHILGTVGTKPFVWTGGSVETMDVDLPGLVRGMGGDFSGSTPQLTAILGVSTPGQPDQGMIWTTAGGIRSMESFLKDELGLASQMVGWTNIHPGTISRNGSHIVGGASQGGRIVLWVATVPEPSTMALAMMAALLARCALRGRSCVARGVSQWSSDAAPRSCPRS